MTKCAALQSIALEIASEPINIVESYITEEDVMQIHEGHVFVFVDTIEARKIIYSGLAGKATVSCWETGLGTDLLLIRKHSFISDFTETMEYIENMPEEEEVLRSECGTITRISVMSTILAGFFTQNFLSFLSGKTHVDGQITICVNPLTILSTMAA